MADPAEVPNTAQCHCKAHYGRNHCRPSPGCILGGCNLEAEPSRNKPKPQSEECSPHEQRCRGGSDGRCWAGSRCGGQVHTLPDTSASILLDTSARQCRLMGLGEDGVIWVNEQFARASGGSQAEGRLQTVGKDAAQEYWGTRLHSCINRD